MDTKDKGIVLSLEEARRSACQSDVLSDKCRCGKEHRDNFFDVYIGLVELGYYETAFPERLFPWVSKEYMGACRLCLDTDGPWTTIYAFIRVYEFMYNAEVPLTPIRDIPENMPKLKEYIRRLRATRPTLKFTGELAELVERST